MVEIRYRHFWLAGILLLLFGLFTAAVLIIDVQPVGPQQSSIGWATINMLVFQLLGKSPLWYDITNWLGAVAILVAAGFGLLGVVQAFQRKSLLRVDKSIIALGVLYATVLGAYVFFEVVVVNYRPILIEGALEASYPSSHTMLVLCIMAAAMIQFRYRIKNSALRRAAYTVSMGVIIVTVGGRLASGAHWFTDIVGGLLLGAALTSCYFAVVKHMRESIYEAPKM